MSPWRHRARELETALPAPPKEGAPLPGGEATGGQEHEGGPKAEAPGSAGKKEIAMTRGEDGSEASVVGKGAKIEGTVIAAGSLRVDGEVKGAIRAKGDVTLSPEGRVEASIQAKNINMAGEVRGDLAAEGDVTLPANSRLEGDLRGRNIDVGGVVKGSIEATGRVQLGRQARVEGDITSKRLAIEDGAVFSGRSVMGDQKAPPAEPTMAAASADRPHVPQRSGEALTPTPGQP